jgi:hypothetical protein
MRSRRIVGVVLLALVGLAFVAFGIDDVLRTELPPVQRAYADRHGVAATPAITAMVLSVFAGQGGFFFGAGLALWILAARPVRLGEPSACAAALSLVVFGNAGIALALHRLGSPFRLLVILLAMGVVGVVLCRRSREPTGDA